MRAFAHDLAQVYSRCAKSKRHETSTPSALANSLVAAMMTTGSLSWPAGLKRLLFHRRDSPQFTLDANERLESRHLARYFAPSDASTAERTSL